MPDTHVLPLCRKLKDASDATVSRRDIDFLSTLDPSEQHASSTVCYLSQLVHPSRSQGSRYLCSPLHDLQYKACSEQLVLFIGGLQLYGFDISCGTRPFMINRTTLHTRSPTCMRRAQPRYPILVRNYRGAVPDCCTSCVDVWLAASRQKDTTSCPTQVQCSSHAFVHVSTVILRLSHPKSQRKSLVKKRTLLPPPPSHISSP